MAEGFELVRTVRQHLRRSAALHDEGKHDEALAEVELALALDAHSLPAQALRDRIRAARPGAAPPSQPADASAARSFVPQGVNAASWRGFEQRITERRFRALVETIGVAIAAGDAAAARDALEEARELRPDAGELADVDRRIAELPASAPAVVQTGGSRLWIRAMGAAALFLVGVSLLLGLDWMRRGDRAVMPLPVTAPEIPAINPTRDARPLQAPALGPVPVAINDDDSVPAIETPPEPLLRPRATSGEAAPAPEPVTSPDTAGRPIASRTPPPAPPPDRPAIERRTVVEDAPVRTARRETPDDYVAPRSAPATPSPAPSRAAIERPIERERPADRPARVIDLPVATDARNSAASAASDSSVVPAVAIPAAEQGRVEEVLQRYARAYDQLDASAARAVWPSVDERALARAFQNLSSQHVSFDGCDIDIRGAVANASCRGQASYAPKVGNREERTEQRLWRFELRRDGDVWKIASAEARRQSSGEYR